MINHPTKEKAHGCDPVRFQKHASHESDFPTEQREGKAFANLAARFALVGHSLTRSNPADGAVIYYAGPWGLSRALPDLQAAAQFLVQIGGAA